MTAPGNCNVHAKPPTLRSTRLQDWNTRLLIGQTFRFTEMSVLDVWALDETIWRISTKNCYMMHRICCVFCFSSILMFALSGCRTNSGSPTDPVLPIRSDYMQVFTPGKTVEWDVDFNENGGARFVGTEYWFVEDATHFPDANKYYMMRVSTGTMDITMWGPPSTAQITGRIERFVITENGAGVLRIPVCSPFQETTVTFASDTADIARYHDVVPGGEVVLRPWLLRTAVDTSQAVLREGVGLTSLYHYHFRQQNAQYPGLTEYWRYSLRLKRDVPQLTDNFFQVLALGDSLVWDYWDSYASPDGYYSYVGKQHWKVVAIDSSSNLRTTTIQVLFTGTKHTGVDSLAISAETSSVRVIEDANHKIIVDLKGNSPSKDLWQYPTFNRYYPPSVGDTMAVKNIFDPWWVTLRREVGLVKMFYFDHGVASITSSGYTLVQQK